MGVEKKERDKYANVRNKEPRGVDKKIVDGRALLKEDGGWKSRAGKISSKSQ